MKTLSAEEREHLLHMAAPYVVKIIKEGIPHPIPFEDEQEARTAFKRNAIAYMNHAIHNPGTYEVHLYDSAKERVLCSTVIDYNYQ